MPGIVVAAIGFQLLLCSVSAAASNTIDRIPGAVAHALRDIIVDRHTAPKCQLRIAVPESLLDDDFIADSSPVRIEQAVFTDQIPGYWLLNLPPPAL